MNKNEKQNKMIIGLLLGILIVLVASISYEVWHLVSYNETKQRQKAIENRLTVIEQRINNKEV